MAASALPSATDPEIWTFGFGSNMNITLLRSKKGLNVLDSTPGVLKEWRLSFQSRALPFVEPSFADARPGALDDELHGVAVLLPGADYSRLAAQESAYDEAHVKIAAYDGRIISARVFTMRSTPLEENAPDIPCSKRYLNVLVSGAREAGLREDYVTRLAARPTYIPNTQTLANREAAFLAYPPTSLPQISVAAFAAEWAPSPYGNAAVDATVIRVAVAGYVFEVNGRAPFGAHRGRDITARAGRQWRGEPLDFNDDRGCPPFITLKHRCDDEKDFILNFFDYYLSRGKIVGFIEEFKKEMDSETAGACNEIGSRKE